MNEWMDGQMNGYIVWRGPNHPPIEVCSLKSSKEIATLYNIFPHSPLWDLAGFIVFTKYFEYLPYAIPFRTYFFTSLWIVSPRRCFSISAPHSPPLQVRDLLLFQQIGTEYLPHTSCCAPCYKYDDRRHKCEPCLHAAPHRQDAPFVILCLAFP